MTDRQPGAAFVAASNQSQTLQGNLADSMRKMLMSTTVLTNQFQSIVRTIMDASVQGRVK